MGYAMTTIVCYGVELSYEQAQQVLAALVGPIDLEEQCPEDAMDAVTVPHDHTLLSPAENPKMVQGLQQPRKHPEARYNTDRVVHDVQLLAHDADSRIGDLALCEGNAHSFGIYCGSRGYAWDDDVSLIMRNPPAAQAVKNWDRYCVAVCKRLGIDVKPELHLIMQLW